LFDRDPRVVLQSRLTRALAGGKAGLAEMGWDKARSVVMIQCVGSREPGRPYCSRTCCTEAVTNAAKLKELLPDASVTVLFRDIRTYGQRELLYKRARELGVQFLRFELPRRPVVSLRRGALSVALTEPVAGVDVALEPDLLVLSTGVSPTDNVALAGALGVRLDRYGFFEEQHPKLRPMDLSRPGIYACGLAHGPCSEDESVAQAQGAAMRAAAFMARAEVQSSPTMVRVNKRLCSFCGLCVTACPFGARVLDYENRVAQVVESLCQGCGVCAMVCPNKATQQQTIEHRATLAEIDAAVIGL
jgi:heterodisulfide reductase subunit A